jgi:hypothetical protein
MVRPSGSGSSSFADGLALVPVFYAVIERMREGGAAEAAQAHAAADD